MNNVVASQLVAHPRLNELREERRTLLQRLTDIVREIHDLKERVLPALLTEYDKHFREFEITLQEKMLLTAEMVRREELFRLKLGRGEKLTEEMIRAVNTVVDKEFERMKKRFQEAFSMSAEEREKAASERSQKHNDSDFTKLYRSIVKKLHPDASVREEGGQTDANSRESDASQAATTPFEQFWQSAQEAYNNRNLRELQAIYDLVVLAEEREDYTTVASAEEHLQQEIMRLQSRLRNEERRLREIVNNPPYTLRDLMKSPTWLEQERSSFRKNIAEKERDFERSKAFLASINALDSNLASTPSSFAEQEAFTNDFMANTYFNNR